MLPILIFIFVLILINGFFAASEMALVSIKPADLYRIKSQGKKNAELLEKITKDSTKYLSTIQVVITFAGFLSSAFAGSQLSGNLVALLAKVNITLSDSLAVVVITVILSFFTLVLGELVPKRIAIINPAKFALFCAPLVNIFMIIFKPFVWLLSISTKGVIRILGLNSKNSQNKITENEIKEMIVYGHIEGLYKSEEKNMMNRIFKLDDLTVEMIMTPKNEVIGLDLTNPDIQNIIESGYSRIPVFRGDKNNIEGVILIKDLVVELIGKNIDEIDLSSLVGEPYIINEDMKVNTLLKKMRTSSKHLAFIINDSNELEGIISLEDIIEEIVGNIYDEHDLINEFSETVNEFGYIFDGNMLISDIEGKLGIKIDSRSDEFHTLWEFVQNRLKKFPKEGKTPIIKIDCGYLRVLKIEDKSIDQIELVIDEEKMK